jgi:hypothetical protein
MVDTGVDSTRDGQGVRWLTYEEAGHLLGIDADSVSRRARRLAWRRQPGNDGRTRVAVPLDVIPDSPPDNRGYDEADIRASVSPDTQSMIKALEGEAAALREALDRERGRLAQAEADVLSARKGEAEARERAARAEGERDALRDGLRASEEARREVETRAAQESAKAVQAQRDAVEAQQRARDAAAALGAFQALPWWRRALFRP